MPLLIDPDVTNTGVDPFYVECEISDGIFTGTTIITPTSSLIEYVTGYESEGSFINNVTYEMSIQQIVTLMTSSTSCRQYMKYECFNSIGVPVSFWISRDGSKMYNWGSPIGFYGCACGYRGDCSDLSEMCECNRNDKVLRYDDGYIEDMSTLPVIQLRHGDTGHFSENGTSTIGPLQCTGLKGVMHFFDNISFVSEYIHSALPVRSLLTCLTLCEQTEQCRSLSISPSNYGSGLVSCTLNKRSAKEISKNNINRDDDYKHFEYYSN
ncbi:neurexin-4-like [Antedon mediterranea]|uniref:neurexin-4-like n=1 Tax=Antedon mediterranea TaxID=105859 RepID=UPI003AF7FEFF